MPVDGTPKPGATVRYPTVPESETVALDFRVWTPFPPPNSNSSGGPPLQAKSNGLVGGFFVGVASVSPLDPSHNGTMSALMSFGNVIVCGSLTSSGRQTTVSPFLTLRLRGRNSRTATCPSRVDVPAHAV